MLMMIRSKESYSIFQITLVFVTNSKLADMLKRSDIIAVFKKLAPSDQTN